MALDKKIISFPLVKGVNDKVEDRNLPLGEFETMNNAQFTKFGEARKRQGFHSISSDIPAIVASDSARTIDTGKALATYQDELLCFDGRYGYSKTSTDNDWVNKGRIVGCGLETELCEAGTNLVQTPARIAQANNFEVQVWSEIDPTETVAQTTFTFNTVDVAGPTGVGGATQTTGSGSPTVTTGGTYSATARLLYQIEITGTGSPNQFKWRTVADDGSASSYTTGVNVATSAVTLNNGVTATFAATTGYSSGDIFQFYVGRRTVDLNLTADHNLSKGANVTVAFAQADWPDGDYAVTATPATDELTLTMAVNTPAPDAATAGTVVVKDGTSTGVTWRTYAKVIDKTTRVEVISKTLVNVFTTANSIYNIPRAQVAASGQYVFIFVHVGSGRVKYTKVDTGSGSGALSANLKPGLLTNTASDVLFSVDLTYPVWSVEAVNNGSISSGIAVFKHLEFTASGTKYMRLSYFGNSGGTLSEETSSPAPVNFSEKPHFPGPTSSVPSSFQQEAYPGAAAKDTLEIVGDLVLKVVTPNDSTTGDYLAIGYTLSDDTTGFASAGSADEPLGVKLQVYNAALQLQNVERTASIDTVTTAYQTTALPGYVLMNGTAGMNEAGQVRFFLTLVANKTSLVARSPEFLVNAYDYYLSGSSNDLVDIDLDLYGMTITTDCFAHKEDLYLGVAYAARPQTVGGDSQIAMSTFDASVGLIIDHQGQVVAKTSLSAGPWAQEINFRFMQYTGFNRLNFMYQVPRVTEEAEIESMLGSIDPAASTTVTGVNTKFTTQLKVGDRILVSGETRRVTAIASDTSLTVNTAFSDNANDTSPQRYRPSKFKFGYSRYSGVNINSEGLDLTAMDAAVGTFDLEPARYLPSVEANGSLKIGSGILWDYSGDYFKEDNFFYYPEVHSIDVSSGTGLEGTFNYIAIFEWVDHNGKVMSSFPSAKISTGSISDKAVTLKIYNLHMTYKRDATTIVNPGGYAAVNLGARSEVKLVLYRTENGGVFYHRCAEKLMDRSDRFQTITDSLSDANLIDNPPLYTIGGLPHVAPPSIRDIAVFKDRVFLATAENTILYSKNFAENNETGFPNDFRLSVDNKAEKINGLCPNLEHLLVFGSKNSYYLSGQGPNAAGAQGAFSPFRTFGPGQSLIPGAVRVESPLGVFFQTRQGIMLCDRSMQTKFIGARVEDHGDFYGDGLVFQDEHEIRFTSDEYGVAVYNYLFDQWSVWGFSTDMDKNAASIIYDNKHYRLSQQGDTYEQQSGSYHDRVSSSNKNYSFGFITGWINVGALQQVGRIYRLLFLGNFNSLSKPQVYFYKNYDESATVIEMDAAPGTSKYQLICKVPTQKVRSFKFGFTEDSAAASGGEFKVQAVSMLVGVKPDSATFKLPTPDQIT